MASRGGRLAKIDRTVRLVGELLAGRVLDASSAARLLGVQRAAAARQLQALAKLKGVTSERKEGRLVYRFDRGQLGPPASTATFISACFGASLAPFFQGTPYEKGLRDVREHVLKQLRRRDTVDDMDRKFVFLRGGGEAALPDSSAHLDELLEALLKHLWVTFESSDFEGARSSYRVRPLSLVVYAHQLYLLALDGEGDTRVFRFARLRNLEATEEAFEYPTRAEYDPDQVFRTSFGVFIGPKYPVERVVLRLDARWKTYAKTHRWHPSQQVRVEGDGVRLTMHVGICPELENWVLGLGPDAEVLEPVTLRATIAERAAALSARYTAPR